MPEEKIIVVKPARSSGVAYGLWLFLGLLQVHRFYLNRPVSAIIILVFVAITAVYTKGMSALMIWGIDAFLIPGMVRDENDPTHGQAQRKSLEEKGANLGRWWRDASTGKRWLTVAGIALAFYIIISVFVGSANAQTIALANSTATSTDATETPAAFTDAITAATETSATVTETPATTTAATATPTEYPPLTSP